METIWKKSSFVKKYNIIKKVNKKKYILKKGSHKKKEIYKVLSKKNEKKSTYWNIFKEKMILYTGVDVVSVIRKVGREKKK